MIHVTFVADTVRGNRRSFDTDDAGEAITEAASKWYGESGREYPRESAVFCVVIERDGATVSRAEVAKILRQTASMEEMRQRHEDERR